jgi:hypothetical protein
MDENLTEKRISEKIRKYRDSTKVWKPLYVKIVPVFLQQTTSYKNTSLRRQDREY